MHLQALLLQPVGLELCRQSISAGNWVKLREVLHFSLFWLPRRKRNLPSSQGRRQMQLRLSLKSSIVSQLGRVRSLGSPLCHSRQKKPARRRNLLFCPSAGALAAGLSAKRRWDAVPLGVIPYEKSYGEPGWRARRTDAEQPPTAASRCSSATGAAC